jgi:MOSC domain-containing protein YiiM
LRRRIVAATFNSIEGHGIRANVDPVLIEICDFPRGLDIQTNTRSAPGFECKEVSPVRLISLNVGRPRLVVYRGKTINTGIFKQPISGPVQLQSLNVDGDRQADLSVHGGIYKAVYAYPSEHYPFWRQEIPDVDLPWGMFGENLTTAGLSEDELHVGDRLQIGSSIVMVRQPRTPCYKLAAKFQRDDMIERFLLSGRSGFYFSVEQEGSVAAEDAFELLTRNQDAITISEMNRLFVREKYHQDLLRKAVHTAALPENWREYFAERLNQPAVASGSTSESR